MELWKETINKVYLEGDAAWAVSAAYAVNGTSAGALSVSWDTINLRWEGTLPYLLNECTIDVTWTFTVPGSGQIVKTDSYEVITPLLSKREISKILDNAATNEEIVEIEAATRHIIQAHTGQAFGKRVKSQVVIGAGETALALPARLISITGLSTLTSVLNPESVIVIADGWYMKKHWSDVISSLTNNNVYWHGEGYYNPEDFPESAPPGFGHVPDRFGHGPIISAPGRRQSPTIWKDDYPFTIAGTWGYERVPDAVAEAAKLLINDYACSEGIYRDRYLESVKAADWSIQFNAQAYLHTGNVRADQLLNDYVMKRGWAIL